MKNRRVFGITVALGLALLTGWLILRDPPREQAAPVVRGGEIRFSQLGLTEDFDFWQETLREFEQATGILVKSEHIARNDPQYNSTLREQLQSETPPDVMLVLLSTFQEFSEQFENLTELSRSAEALDLSAFEPTGVKAFEVQGQQRGLPFSGGNLLIFLNRKAFQKASEFHGKPVELPGEDWTVAQFLRTAEALTCDFDRDGETDQFGFWLPQWINYLPFIWSFGADITDEQATRWTFSGPPAQSVMRFYRQLATGDRVAPRNDEASPSLDDMGFLSGKTAMCVNGPRFLAVLDQSNLAGDYAVAPIPRGPGGRATPITWDGIVMKKTLPSEQRERATQLIQWLLSRDVQNRWARTGRGLPARVDAQEAFVAADPPRRKPFIDALSYSRLQPPLPRFESIDRAITRHFGEAVDPNRAFEALTMLDELARDPAVVDAFSNAAPGRP